MDDTKLRAYRNLASAVMDLVDGMGGDDQEWDRGQQICQAILALPDTLQPACELPLHEVARDAWFAQQEMRETRKRRRP